MIVDDSMIARAVLSRIIESDGAFEIAAVAGTAEDAIDALRTVKVDIVLLDLEMPGAGGLKMIPEILEAAGGARIMIVSSLADEGKEQTIAALALGATDAMRGPSNEGDPLRHLHALAARDDRLALEGRAEVIEPQVDGNDGDEAVERDPDGCPARGIDEADDRS